MIIYDYFWSLFEHFSNMTEIQDGGRDPRWRPFGKNAVCLRLMTSTRHVNYIKARMHSATLRTMNVNCFTRHG